MKRIILGVLLLLFIGVQTSFAQFLPELSEQYTSADGMLVVHYPSDWLVMDDDEIIILAHKSVVDEVENDEPIPDGYFVMSLVLPSQLDEMDLSLTANPDDVLERVIELSGLSGEVEPYARLGVQGASAMVSGAEVSHGQLVALQFETGTLFSAIEFSDDVDTFMNQAQNWVAHILGGLIYNGQSAADGNVNAALIQDDATSQTQPQGEEIRQWARAATGTSQYGEQGWGFVQATGAPNTNTCGDNSTSWASRSSTGADRLTLTFDRAVVPSQVNIHQTYNPGSIIGVELFNVETGETVGIPNSVDPPGNTPCLGVYTLNVMDISTPMNGVVIYVDQEIGGSWNEIDAVELVGYEQATAPTPAPVVESTAQWANFATGSSQYGEQGWSFMQATGAPDAIDCGDSLQAWASETVGGSEILALEFEHEVIPAQVNIHQNYNPGAITRIELTNTDTGAVIPVPDSADAPGNTACPGVFTVDISGVDTPVNGVILYLDQSLVGSWNEIDAVELVGTSDSSTSSGRATAQPTTTSEEESTFVIISDLDMSETFTFDGANHLTISYPTGWVTDVSQLPAIASSQDALATLQRGAPLPENGIAIGIIPPKDMLGALGITPSDSASQTLSDLADRFGVMDVEMGPHQGLDYPAFSAPLTGTRMLPPNTHVLTVEHPNGVVTFLIVTEDFSAWDQLIKEMVSSLALS